MKTEILKYIDMKITGISKLIMHNGRLAGSSDPMTKACDVAQKANKKNPTDENWEKFAQAMMAGGLYFTEELGAYIPEDNLRSMIIRAGQKTTQKGMKTYKEEASAINFECDYGFPILVDGKPQKDFNALLTDTKWRFCKLVVIRKSRVRSVRPVFPTGWTANVKLSYMPSVIDAETVQGLFEKAGLEVGIGDWRPSSPKPGPFGRFLVESFKEVSE